MEEIWLILVSVSLVKKIIKKIVLQLPYKALMDMIIEKTGCLQDCKSTAFKKLSVLIITLELTEEHHQATSPQL